MKRALLRVSLVSALVGLTAGAAFAQQAEPDRYVVISYIKVQPGQDEAYRQYLATTGKKFFQEMRAANSNFLTWSAANCRDAQGVENVSPVRYIPVHQVHLVQSAM